MSLFAPPRGFAHRSIGFPARMGGGSPAELRALIVSRLARRRPPFEHRPVFMLKLGPPASGKTTAANVVYRALGLHRRSFLLLDVDGFVLRYTPFNDDAKLIPAGPERERRLIDLYYRHRATIDDLVEVYLFRAATARRNIELESTGSDASTKWLLGFLPDLVRLGYRIVVVYPYVLPRELENRLVLRNQAQVRQVDVGVLAPLKAQVERNLHKFAPLAEHVYVIDNNRKRPELLADLHRKGPTCLLPSCNRLPSFLRPRK